MNRYDIIEEEKVGFNYDYLKKVIDYALKLENVNKAIFSIIFVNDEIMHKMNKDYRGVDNTTDVLSFAYEDNESLKLENRILGEIFISIPKMEEQAKNYGHSKKRELAFLVVHGLLHLLGYDHTLGKKEEEEMFSRQELVLNEFEETRRTQKNEY